MKTGILDLAKWAEKAAQVVQKICRTKQGPCVGMCLLFLELDQTGKKHWNFTIHMAGDPEDMTSEERKQLEKTMEYVAAGMQKAYEGADKEISEFTAVGSFD